MSKSFWPAIGTAAALALSACASAPSSKTIADATATTPQLSTLNKLIGEAGLEKTLSGPGPFTVFAPTNDAFNAVPAKTLEALGKDPALLTSVLTYHVLAGKVAAADVKNGPAKTLQGGNVALSKAGAFVTVEEAVVTTADVPVSNGVVHLIDRVLLPPAPK